MKTLNIASIVAVLAIAVTLTSCDTPSADHPWWTGEPVVRDGKVVYLPQQTDGDELLVGQGDGEEPAGCRSEFDDGTCLAGSDQVRFAQRDRTDRYSRPLTPSAARR